MNMVYDMLDANEMLYKYCAVFTAVMLLSSLCFVFPYCSPLPTTQSPFPELRAFMRYVYVSSLLT